MNYSSPPPVFLSLSVESFPELMKRKSSQTFAIVNNTLLSISPHADISLRRALINCVGTLAKVFFLTLKENNFKKKTNKNHKAESKSNLKMNSCDIGSRKRRNRGCSTQAN